MVGNVSRVALVVLLLQSLLTLNAGGYPVQLGPGSGPPLWVVEVATFEQAAPPALWVGLVNRSSQARLVCVADRGISYKESDDSLKAVMDGGSPHACDVEDQFELVRAGETEFIRLPLPDKLSEKVSGRIRVELGVVDHPALGKALRRDRVGLTWEGTLYEAGELGRALVTPTIKRK
jgi:hypothetical protein